MIRKPAVSGAFYPSNSKELKRMIENCFLGDLGPGYIPKLKEFKGNDYPINIFAPHAGYIYSGPIAAHAYAKLVENGFPETFIVVCPNHTGEGTSLSISNDDEWISPLGKIEVDKEFVELIDSNSKYSNLDCRAHSREHSIEVHIPFLQYFSNDFKIVPVCMGIQDLAIASDLAEAIIKASKELGRTYSVIASSDLSHYNVQEKARELDTIALNDIKNMQAAKLVQDVMDNDISMCGFGPVMSNILLSKLTGKENCQILAYGTSGDVSGDLSSVVGYSSGIFTK